MLDEIPDRHVGGEIADDEQPARSEQAVKLAVELPDNAIRQIIVKAGTINQIVPIQATQLYRGL